MKSWLGPSSITWILWIPYDYSDHQCLRTQKVQLRTSCYTCNRFVGFLYLFLVFFSHTDAFQYSWEKFQLSVKCESCDISTIKSSQKFGLIIQSGPGDGRTTQLCFWISFLLLDWVDPQFVSRFLPFLFAKTRSNQRMSKNTKNEAYYLVICFYHIALCGTLWKQRSSDH